jgi:hypothetical protein
MTGFFDVLKSSIASWTSSTWPQSALETDGRMTSAWMRVSAFARAMASIVARSVGARCRNWRRTSEASISSKGASMGSERVARAGTVGGGSTNSATVSSAPADSITAARINTMTTTTPRRTATATSQAV